MDTSLVSAELIDGWRLVPLDDDDLAGLGLDFSACAEGFSYLSPSLAEFCVEYSRLGPVVYFETEYFGGMGSQAAAAFVDGAVLLSGVGDDAINSALRMIGITANAGMDEFDHLGLSRYRHTSDWRESATR